MTDYSNWRNEYLWELGRLVIAGRLAKGSTQDKLRELMKLPIPLTQSQWDTVGSQWRRVEIEMKQAGEWPRNPWEHQ